MPSTTLSLVVIEDAALARDLAAVPRLAGETKHVLCRGQQEDFSDFLGRLCARFVELRRNHAINRVSYFVAACDPEASSERRYFLRYLLNTLDDGCELDLVTPNTGTADLLRALDELLPMAAPGVSIKARSAMRTGATPTTPVAQPPGSRGPSTLATASFHRSQFGVPAGSLAS